MPRIVLLCVALLLGCAPAPARPAAPPNTPAVAVPGLTLALSTPTPLSVRVQNASGSTTTLIGDTRIENDGAHLTVLGMNLSPRATEPDDWHTQCLAVTTRAATGWVCNLPDLAPGQASTVVFVAANSGQVARISDVGLQGYATGGAKVTVFQSP